MSKHRVIYIDDSPEIIEDYMVYAEDFNLEIETVPLVPDINVIVSEIVNANAEAVIVDYLLSESRRDIKYNGTDILNLLEKKTEGVPKFIFTSYPIDAENAADDINIVYEKNNKENTSKFFERVIKQIDKAKGRLASEESELQTLITKSRNNVLSSIEEERLLELDTIIENKLHKPTALPNSLKQTSTIKTLNEILKKTSEIVTNLEINNGQN